MATRSHLLYSIAATRRMLGLSASTPVQIREFFRVIWVWVQGQRPTFISKSRFKAHFVEQRKAAAQSLKVSPDGLVGDRFTVTNPQTHSMYPVTCTPTQLACTCEDYTMQQQVFGRGCCKHGYAVLHYLGFNSLEAYLRAGRTTFPVKQAA